MSWPWTSRALQHPARAVCRGLCSPVWAILQVQVLENSATSTELVHQACHIQAAGEPAGKGLERVSRACRYTPWKQPVETEAAYLACTSVCWAANCAACVWPPSLTAEGGTAAAAADMAIAGRQVRTYSSGQMLATPLRLPAARCRAAAGRK